VYIINHCFFFISSFILFYCVSALLRVGIMRSIQTTKIRVWNRRSP